MRSKQTCPSGEISNRYSRRVQARMAGMIRRDCKWILAPLKTMPFLALFIFRHCEFVIVSVCVLSLQAEFKYLYPLIKKLNSRVLTNQSPHKRQEEFHCILTLFVFKLCLFQLLHLGFDNLLFPRYTAFSNKTQNNVFF
mmetsp:Transcript_58244/g.92551  ORF Transcript_58244/g.92551 Transcript_58244/m.92551 type:complete len:139 (+) Transcript_58244:611-1027(+)